jgi:glycine hydroxymethyltransferase
VKNIDFLDKSILLGNLKKQEYIDLISMWWYYSLTFWRPKLSVNPKRDTEIERFLKLEAKRQKDTINLIAAENYASRSVLDAQGSILTNKYAEGYPHRRYYAGCPNIDAIERLAIERAEKLFNAEHANVQPHSGSQANMAAYFATIVPGDTVMGMSLSHGGHLTHGAPANFSGKWYKFVAYGLDPETERLDYDEVEKLAMKHKPKLIVCGASAYPRTIDFARFRRCPTCGRYGPSGRTGCCKLTPFTRTSCPNSYLVHS